MPRGGVWVKLGGQLVPEVVAEAEPAGPFVCLHHPLALVQPVSLLDVAGAATPPTPGLRVCPIGAQGTGVGVAVVRSRLRPSQSFRIRSSCVGLCGCGAAMSCWNFATLTPV